MRWTNIVCLLLVAACSRELAQKNEDGLKGSFDGKVLRSTHPSVAEGTRCEGTIERKAASSTAHVTVVCSGISIYDGTGAFSLDVRDPKKREDDRIEFNDAKTSDVDKTPACNLVGENAKADGAGGTLTVRDAGGKTAFEIVVVL